MIMDSLKRFLFSSYCMKIIMDVVEYLMLDFFYSGGWPFYIFELIYLYTFDLFKRQKPKECMSPEKNHWENPEIFGENRRDPHVPLKSFPSTKSALEYWDKGGGPDNLHLLSNICMLTGNSGSPSKLHPWKFSMQGSPLEIPNKWEQPIFDDSLWGSVFLPGHWQLQGYDIPIYTNTSYPFEFDPPNVRRTGKWAATDCDKGLGGTTTDFGELSPLEPGPNSTGLYRRKFSIPHEWRKAKAPSRFFLVLEGVDSCADIWVNGKHIGYSQDSCLSCEFDITQALKINQESSSSVPGRGGDDDDDDDDDDHISCHTIAIRVLRWCDGSYLEDQDKWWLSGIYREIYIIRKPEIMICDYEIKNTITWNENDDPISAVIDVDVLVENYKQSDEFSSFDSDLASIEGCSIRAELYRVGSIETPLQMVTVTCRHGGEFTTKISADSLDFPKEKTDKFKNPGCFSLQLSLDSNNLALWSAEAPHLYIILITLHESSDDAFMATKILDIEGQRFGIRQVDIGGAYNQLRLNKKPLLIAGVNRHEFDCYQGRSVDENNMRKDALLMKQFNFNAVRCAHYPHHPRWLEICDAIGLMVIDEANIESHGFQTIGQAVGYLSNRKEWMGAHMSRIIRMYERDKNSTSVLIWSLGNESGVGKSHKMGYQWLKKRDVGRPVQYESGGAASNVTDIICPMYHRPRWCKQKAEFDYKRRPVILCEYSHAMGNSAGGLEEYWDLFRDYTISRAQGGFIWDFIDQGLVLPGSSGEVIKYGYGGDFSDYPNTQQFCCNGILGPDRSPHPIAFQAKALQSPIQFELQIIEKPTGVLFSDIYVVINNHFTFIDTSNIEFHVSVNCDSPKFLNKNTKSFKFSIKSSTSKSFNLHTLFLPSETNSLSSCDTLISQLGYSMQLSLEELSLASEIWFDVKATSKSPSVFGQYIDSSPSTADSTNEIIHNTFQHEVLHDALKELQGKCRLKTLPFHRDPPPSNSTVNTKSDNDGNLMIEWTDGSRAILSSFSGQISEWLDAYQNKILVSPVDVCLYRAPTDNDLGGALISYASQWKAAGLDNLSKSKIDIKILDPASVNLIAKFQEDLNSVEVEVSFQLKPTNRSILRYTIPVKVRYSFYSNGSIKMKYDIQIPRQLPSLPRIGVRFSVPDTHANIEWFGLGPYEAYDDRKKCVYLDQFRQTVDELHVPYVVPQESGRRAQPRWVFLQKNKEKSGLMVVPLPESSPKITQEHFTYSNYKIISGPINASMNSEASWGWSASRYSLESKCESTHDFALKEKTDNQIYFHLDRFSMGLGGYDSWSPNVSKNFLLKNGLPISFEFVLFPIKDQGLNSQELNAIYAEIAKHANA